MAGFDVLQRRLATLSADELAELLTRRNDVLAGPRPRDLGELAQRLWHQYSLLEVIHTLGTPQLQVLEAAASLGDGCPVEVVAELLADSGPDHREVVDQIVHELLALAVLADYGDDRLALPAMLGPLIPNPLQLGRPLYHLIGDLNVDRLRQILSRLGLPTAGKRGDLVLALRGYFADLDNVFGLLAEAPDDVRTYLAARAAEPGYLDDYDAFDDDYYDRDVRRSPRFDPNGGLVPGMAYPQQRAAETWAADRALLIPQGWSGLGGAIPSEVALALRGRDWRAPFLPSEPHVPTRPVDPTRLEQASAAAASEIFGHLLAVLDHVARHPVPTLKSGGIGARELAKLAKGSGVDDAVVRLTLECAADLGLFEPGAAGVTVSSRFAVWRGLEPGEQLASMLRAWWAMASNPTESHDGDGKVRPALLRHDDAAIAFARIVLLEVLTGLPPDSAAERSDVVAAVRWRQPFVRITVAEAKDPLATPWHEAELLGVISAGALTALGRALRIDAVGTIHDDAPNALITATRAALPAVADRATFGSDLTAYAVGAPSARITAVLDASADRESSGGAITWRFSPASVRRALDDGAVADVLLAELTEIAGGELPQPLRYLFADVARRHGHLRLSAATSVVTSDDHALLAEVVADRKLAKHGLRLLAPSVLAADTPLETLLAALRAAGYLPVVDAPVDTPVTVAAGKPDVTADANLARVKAFMAEQLTPERAAGIAPRLVAAEHAKPVDPAAVAKSLLKKTKNATSADEDGATTRTETALRRSNTRLSPTELRQLAYAIDKKGRVLIEYRSQSGGLTLRVIRNIELAGSTLYAWCELRSDERFFAVANILSVAAV